MAFLITYLAMIWNSFGNEWHLVHKNVDNFENVRQWVYKRVCVRYVRERDSITDKDREVEGMRTHTFKNSK